MATFATYALVNRYRLRGRVRRYQNHEAFQQAIMAHPLDFDPRRVYADWLEEHGDRRGRWLRASTDWLARHTQGPVQWPRGRKAIQAQDRPPNSGEADNYVDRALEWLADTTYDSDASLGLYGLAAVLGTPLHGERRMAELLPPRTQQALAARHLHMTGLLSNEAMAQIARGATGDHPRFNTMNHADSASEHAVEAASRLLDPEDSFGPMATIHPLYAAAVHDHFARTNDARRSHGQGAVGSSWQLVVARDLQKRKDLVEGPTGRDWLNL